MGKDMGDALGFYILALQAKKKIQIKDCLLIDFP
jgi:hypothetical protein